jgi:predicted ATPase
MITLATTYDLPFWGASGTIQRGYALVKQGQEREGMALMDQGLGALRDMGARLNFSRYLMLLAEAYRDAEQSDKGLTLLCEASAMMDHSEERVYEPELYRLKGELTLQKGAGDWGLGTGSSSPHAPSLKPLVPKEEAEGYFLKAIAIAQKQHGKSLELRASVSLAHLWQQQGKTAEAHRMLSEIYHWFTEGFETKDLQEAKALLEGLEPR